jgi:hypothetical protein
MLGQHLHRHLQVTQYPVNLARCGTTALPAPPTGHTVSNNLAHCRRTALPAPPTLFSIHTNGLIMVEQHLQCHLQVTQYQVNLACCRRTELPTPPPAPTTGHGKPIIHGTCVVVGKHFQRHLQVLTCDGIVVGQKFQRHLQVTQKSGQR